ncbi:hypothetical protein PO909_012993 [Leuciscus waleckii]
MFDPNSAEGCDIHAYLKDIDFYLQTVANVTAWDNLYLLRITASSDVRSFLDRQPETVKTDSQQLRQALIREFSDPDSDQGFIVAVDLKQGRREHPQIYYNRLRQAFFGARNEPGMEQDVTFKTLFLRNLHPTLSHHIGVLADARTMSTQQLRDLAHKAYTKQKTISEKTVKNPTIYSVSEHCSELTLEGAPQHHSHRHFYRESRPFQTNRGQHNHGGARPQHQSERSERFWEAGRRPKKSRSPPSRTTSPDREWNHSRHDTGKLKPELTSDNHSAATSETAEIPRVLKELLHQKRRKKDKKDEPHILCLSIRTETKPSDRHLTEPSTLNTARPPQPTELTVTSQGDSITQAPQLTAVHHERNSTLPQTRYHNHKVPGNAVSANCLRSKLHETGPNHPTTVTPVPMPMFLGNLFKKGVAQKLYLNITLEKEVSMEALIDTGSDITIISVQLFQRLQCKAKRQDQTLTPQTCELNVQSYSQHDIRLEQVAHIHLTIGPLSLLHPVFISKMDTFPFLIGRDLLDRFEPLLDLKQLKVWAQVREPLPLQPHRSSEPDGQVTEVTRTSAEPDFQATEFMGTPTASHEDTDSAPTEGSNPLPCTLQPTKDFDTCCLKVMTDLQRHDLTHAIAKPGALNNKLWSLQTHPPTLKREVITHSIRTLQATLPTSEPLTLAPLFAKTTTTDMRASDIYIKTSNAHLSNPSNHPCMPSDLTDNQCLRPLHDTTHMLREQKNILSCAPIDITMPRLVMPWRTKGGKLLMFVYNASCATHSSTRDTDETLKQATSRQQDVAKHGPRRTKPSRRPRSKKTALSNQRQPLLASSSPFSLSLPVVCTRLLLWFAMLYCQPTTGQLPPREQLRLQITDRKTYPQQVHVRLIQACPVYRAHYPSSVAQYIGTSARRTEDSLSHAEAKVEHMFNQLEKVTVTQLGLLSTNHHSRRLLGVLLRVVAATRTLFNIGTSSVNAANQTANSMKPLFTVLQSDFVQTQLVTALTTDMLWEVNSSNDSLATGVIPPYLILSLMLTVLASAINTPADLLQIHLAYSLGSAISLCVDPEQREVGFLLNLPIIESSQVYRLTDIVKVRFWKNNTHIKISPPDVVAYHDSDTQRYSAPNLHLCTMTKDIHYLCLSKPLLRDNAEEIYGLHPLVSKVTNTQAEIAGERWRANTPVHTATVTHDQHDTTSRVNMLNQKMGLQVPKGVILHLDGLTWYQLPSKEYQTALKLPSSKNFNFTLNPGLELWIEKRGSQLTDPAPVNTALRALSRRPVLNTSSAVQAGTAAYIGLCTSAVNQPHPNTRLASILSRRLNEMRYSQAHESCVQRFQMESPERGCQIRDHAEPHRAESSAPRTTCLPTVMIHLLHDCHDSPTM